MEAGLPSPVVFSRKPSQIPTSEICHLEPLERLNGRRSYVWSRRSNSPKPSPDQKSITWRKGPSFSSWSGTISEKHPPKESKPVENHRIAEVEKFSQWIDDFFNAAKNGEDLLQFHQQIKELGYIVRDGNNQTLLHALSSGGQLSYVKYILTSYKSKIDLDALDNNNWTPLFCALNKGHLEIADMLLKHGADVGNKTNTDATALHLLAVTPAKAKKLFKHVFHEIIQRNCNPSQVDSAGNTPLHTACSHGNLYMIKQILKTSSRDIVTLNYSGLTCMDVALRSPHLHVASFLMTKVDSFLLQSLPDEVWIKIMSYVEAADVCHIGQTCKRFRQIMFEAKIWEAQFKEKFGSIVHLKYGEDSWFKIYQKFHTSSLFPHIEIPPLIEANIGLRSHLDIVLIGDLNVGKSSLILRYTQRSFCEEKPPYDEGFYEGPELHLNGLKFNIRLWDIPRKRPIGIGRYRSRHAIILVYDVGNRESFSRLKTWHQEIAHYSKDSIVLIVGNKCDVEERTVSVMEALEFVSEFDQDYLEVSAKNDTNVGALFRRVAERVLSTHVNSQLREKKCRIM
eukprot:TRINITY_DN6003_c0_g1_i1.p1 TRINITY_DN6003_c0_g1~~TRINITY_DN6003_c0_g1_i1.p1  ORF type:complete len:566 (+),score=53.35 TRINITY_DN6003_c0_g1_i1:35-1732(+)